MSRNIEKIEKVKSLAADLFKCLKKANQMSQKSFEMSQDNNITKVRRDKMRHSLDAQYEQYDRIFHRLHCATVEADIAEKFDDDYYGDFEYSPNSWHTHKGNRPKPTK